MNPIGNPEQSHEAPASREPPAVHLMNPIGNPEQSHESTNRSEEVDEAQ